ncbi:X-Pro dipeptidyl-peptidase C-terminal non-catalytic domain-containing protein [Bisporella sp. PMI_857]|nr:X-Pro dipeptidyl-peptidase C-terminal non-catalytic domain-containing protein [Bisporella sp. PMI_857]
MAPYVKQIRKTETLPKGWKKTPAHRALPCDLIYSQNEEIVLRDGVKIYCDVIRPVTDNRVPAILSISPYGKGGHGFLIFDHQPFRLGLPQSGWSGLEKFEGVDPAEWGSRGYAVVNIDIRGTWESEGNMYMEGTQAGRDGYDCCEHVGAQPWCSGSVSMAGNSWLATTQWVTAVEFPPSLKCIAPWEGFTNFYRQVCARGGVPKTSFLGFIARKTIRGRNKQEDVKAALEKWPFYNAYWHDKNVDASSLTLPIYAVGSYSSAIHPFGTIKAFNEAQSKDKWLRIHSTQEWYDLYTPEATDDLQKFFDRYLKGIENGWEQTPRVRVSILTFRDRAGPNSMDNIPFSEYPPKGTRHQKLYLAQSGLSTEKAHQAATISYQSDTYAVKPAEFRLRFDTDSTLVGYAKVRLHMSCADNNDMDVYVSLRKVDRDGNTLEHINIPWHSLPDNCFGPTGILRASHRAQDPKLSTNIIPYHFHDQEEKIAPGTVVPLDIGLWPMGIHFKKGESVLLRVQGFIDQSNDFPQQIDAKLENLNRGKHTIHFGGEYDSHILLPFVDLAQE